MSRPQVSHQAHPDWARVSGLDELLSADRLIGQVQLRETLLGLCEGLSDESSSEVGGFAETILREPRLMYKALHQFEEPKLSQLLCSGNRGAFSKARMVSSDAQGRVFLSGHGYLQTATRCEELRLERNSAHDTFRVYQGDGLIPANLSPRVVIPGTDVEVVRFVDPIIEEFFASYLGIEAEELKLVEPTDSHLKSLERAIEVISVVDSAFRDGLLSSLKSVVLFDHPTLNSLAAIQLHGMIFLNVRWPQTISFCVDGLVHQGGHILCNEATLDRQKFFKVDPDTEVGVLTKRQDSRSVYEALHGLYTEYSLIRILLGIEAGQLLDGRELLETYGRLAFICSRFRHDLETLSEIRQQLFSTDGLALYDSCMELSMWLSDNRSDLCDANLTGQDDEFDLEQFQNCNR
jgi:hypothetical protein